MTVSLKSATSNLIKWGRITGRVNPVTYSKKCQTDMENIGLEKLDSEGTTKVAIESPDRSRFEKAGAIQYLKDEMKNQKNAMANLTAKIEKLFSQKQQVSLPSPDQQQEVQKTERITKRQAQRHQMKQKQKINIDQQQETQEEGQMPASSEDIHPPTNNEGWTNVTRSRHAEKPKAPREEDKQRVNNAETLVKKRVPRSEAIVIGNVAEETSLG